MAIYRTLKLLAVAALLPCAAAFTQTAPASSPLQLSPAFRELARASGYIFIGTVTSVLPGRLLNTIATVDVTFRVEKAYRGVRRGQSLTIHQWSALWNSGQRYKPGERVLLFLYPQSRLGLTSIVGEPAGRIRISASQFIFSPSQYATWFKPMSSSIDRPQLPEQRVGARQISDAVLRASRELQ